MDTLKSKELILERVARNKPGHSSLPDISFFKKNSKGSLITFSKGLNNTGGSIYVIHDLEELVSIVRENYAKDGRVFSPISDVQKLIAQVPTDLNDGHDLEDVEVAIIRAHFAVAENGAVWVTDDLMGNRALPYICQHLAVVINEHDIVPTMHEAYLHPSLNQYNYGSFIAGPSKTADIEQSLVLGAHGPKSMAVFVLLNQRWISK
ncbi:MAG TPA: LUD domain-containing protein [Mucilaginibacter sp.]|jgi:L-lactate dehydrogenase complex protein LldG